MIIATYYWCHRVLVHALADDEKLVTDNSLTLLMIRGLSHIYQVMASILHLHFPFHPFV